MAQQVADILGCDLAMATSLFEAAGGNLELAIELGFGGGGDVAAAAAPSSGGWQPPYPHYQAIWPEAEPLKESWQKQRLDAWYDANSDGIIQDANGPCGVLAVVQAEMWLQDPSKSKEERLATAVSNILQRVLTASNANMVQMADGKTMLSLPEAAHTIRTAAELVEAAATTAGVGTKVTRMTPLVEGPHWLCSSDLMTLLLRGRIGNGSFAAFDMATKAKTSFYSNESPIGVLSTMECDEKIPVADDLKFDKKVWVLHTGDHFVTMSPKSSSDSSIIAMEIYDGLKPNGPVTMTYHVQGNTTLAPKAPDHHVETFVKKRPGQSDDIVQAKKTDSPNYQDWSFEVVPAVDDPDVHGPLDDDPKEPVYNFQELSLPSDTNWRCAACYSNRFKTMNFGTNPAGTTECQVCHLPAPTAMWSLWLPYAELSPRMKARARQMYAPKYEQILATLYPQADIVEAK